MDECGFFVLKNKKVLLRERKRHTARRVVSTPSVVLTGYPPVLTWLEGYPTWVPPGRVPTCPDLAGGYPTWVPPGRGVLYLGTSPAGYPHPSRVPPAGYPPAGPGRVPDPLGVCPMEFWVMLQSIMGYGYPPPPGVDRLKTLPSPSFGCGR